VMAVIFVAAAATVALVPLPPVPTGTCGPSTSSESAGAAFFNPKSIGAGPEPAARSAGHPQWQSFVNACQSLADTRMAVVGGVLVGALLIGLGLPLAVRRFSNEGDIPHAVFPPPGWYPDPADPKMMRWWDGKSWSHAYTHPADPQLHTQLPS